MKRITLLYPHTHDGVAHASGVSLELPDTWANWLIEHGIAQAAAADVQVTVPPPLPSSSAPDTAAPLAPTGDTP